MEYMSERVEIYVPLDT